MTLDPEKFEKLAEVVTKALELKNDFSKKFVMEALAAIQRFDEKHTEKGMGDYAEFGGVGVLIRMSEKYKPLVRHYKNQEQLKKDALTKGWEDCAVYSLMGKLVENGEWGEN